MLFQACTYKPSRPYCMAVLAIRAWGWSRKRAVLVFGILLLVDLALLSSNLLKLLRGGWVPLLVALVVFAIVRTWRWGRAAIHSRLAAMPVMTVRELGHLKARPNGLMPRAIVIMAPQGVSSLDDPVPALCQIFWERYRQIPHHLIFLTVEQLHERAEQRHIARQPDGNGTPRTHQ